MIKESKKKKVGTPVTIRFPSDLLGMIKHYIDISKGEIRNKSQAVIDLLIYAFDCKQKHKEKFIEDIESTFSVENKLLIPINTYKKLLSKSSIAIKREIQNGVIEEIEINKAIFIIIEAQSNYSDVILELLVQKKDIEILRDKIKRIENSPVL